MRSIWKHRYAGNNRRLISDLESKDCFSKICRCTRTWLRFFKKLFRIFFFFRFFFKNYFRIFFLNYFRIFFFNYFRILKKESRSCYRCDAEFSQAFVRWTDSHFSDGLGASHSWRLRIRRPGLASGLLDHPLSLFRPSAAGEGWRQSGHAPANAPGDHFLRPFQMFKRSSTFKWIPNKNELCHISTQLYGDAYYKAPHDLFVKALIRYNVPTYIYRYAYSDPLSNGTGD